MVRSLAAAIVLLACAAAHSEERVVNVKVRADSEHPGDNAFKAMDGDAATIWHSQWKPPANVTPLPHEIVVDLGGIYEISGFTYAPRPNSRNGRIKDYEVYLGGPGTSSLPLAGNIGEPIAGGTFENPDGENVVRFVSPVKGRYFRLRALSNVTGQETWAGIGDLQLHCEGVKFVGKPWSLLVDFPDAGAEAIALIEDFPLLAKLLELDNPWGSDPVHLRDHLFPEGIEPFGGEEDFGVFTDRRMSHDWRKITYAELEERDPVDNLGQRIWNRYAYETDYYALDYARPMIRMQLGQPLLRHIGEMQVLFPKIPAAARGDIPARMDRIAEALKPYGAQKLPKDYKSYPYILPGGTKMTITDYTIDPPGGQVGDYDHVRIMIDFEPAAPAAGREQMPQLVPWRAADAGGQANSGPAMALEYLQQSGKSGATAGTTAARGESPARPWSDKPDGFASVDALGVNGTTGGAGGKVVTVTTQEELEKYALAEEPYIIRVPGKIKITEKQNPQTRYERLTTREVHIASNKTIIGVGKGGHIVGGGFFIGPGMHNIILRNLTIRDTFVEGDWPGLTNDYDGLQMDDAHHVWVDHCHFSRHGDGCLDSRAGTTYLTVSWCIFSDHNKTFGVGWDRKAAAHITLHHSWFRNLGCRSPGAGQVLRAHYYNNYLQNIGSCSHRALIGTNMIIQNSYFDNVTAPQRQTDATVTMIATGCIYNNVRGDRVTCGRVFFDPSRFYPYTLDKAEDIPGLLEKYAGPQEDIGK